MSCTCEFIQEENKNEKQKRKKKQIQNTNRHVFILYVRLASFSTSRPNDFVRKCRTYQLHTVFYLFRNSFSFWSFGKCSTSIRLSLFLLLVSFEAFFSSLTRVLIVCQNWIVHNELIEIFAPLWDGKRLHIRSVSTIFFYFFTFRSLLMLVRHEFHVRESISEYINIWTLKLYKLSHFTHQLFYGIVKILGYVTCST